MLRSVFFITLFAAGVAYGSVIFEPAGDGRMALVRGSAGAVVLRSDRADFQTGPASVAMVLDGAWQRRPVFEEPLPGFSNYFKGSTPGQWRTGVPHYARVRFADVLPRVDLVYYGQESKLEYDFVLRPGANPRSIRLSFPGARKVRVRDGNLVISTSDGRELLHRRPLVYQQSHRWRAEVPARWRIDGEGRARIEPGVYDTSKPLIIDPVVEIASWIGKTGQDAAFAIATDSAGNAWVAGETNSPDLGTGGAYQSARALPTDAFLAKIAPDGAVLAITYYGGSKSDTGLGVAVDSSGNAYLLGVTSSPDLPVPGAAQESFAGGEHDVFVAKFDPSASRLLWATYAGGSHAEWAGSITTDAAGNPWITGWTLSADYPLAGALQRGTAGGGGDAFLTRIAAWGGSFTYSTYFGAEGIDQGSGVAVDGAGNVHLTGMSESNALPVTPATLPRRAGKGDAFYAKLDPVRNQLLVCTYVGGMGVDYGVRAATDRDGNGYVAGYTQSADLRITPGSFQTKPGGGTDIFVARINAASGNLDYATYLGGSGEDWLGGLAVDAAGSASVGGWSNSRDFPLRTPAQGANAGGDRANTGGFDAVAARLSPSGANLVYSTYYGGAGEDRALGVAVDAAGRTWLAGTTSSRDLPSAAGAFSAGPFTEEDAFVVKFSADAGAVFLTVNPAAVNVTVRSGANGVPPISLQVRPSAGTVPFSVSSDVGWLRPVQATGTAPAQLSVTLESFRLPVGEHTGNIVIRSAADTVSVPVKVSVTAAPTITAVTPPALTAGSPDTRVTISGAAFAAGMSVEASGMPLQATVVDSGTLTVTIPRELLRTEGVLNLVVASVPLRSPAFAIPITAPRPTIAGAGIVNAATWVPGRVAPGQFFIIGGAGFGSESLVSSTLDSHGRFATSVAGVRVLVDEQPVPVLWLRSGVVAGQIPYGAAGKDSVRIAIEADGVTSLPVTVGVQPASPGLFTAAGTGSGQAAALNEDGAPNSASQPARRGSTIVLFAHGAGLVQPAVPEGTPVPADLVVRPQLPVEVLIGGRKAAPEYVGVAPRLISGMLQLNVRVPADAQTGANVPVVLIVGDYASPPAAIAIREETAGAAFAPLH